MATTIEFSLEKPFYGFMERYRELIRDEKKVKPRLKILKLLKLKSDMNLKMGDNDLTPYIGMDIDDERRSEFVDMLFMKKPYDSPDLTREELDRGICRIAEICGYWYSLLDEINETIKFLNHGKS